MPSVLHRVLAARVLAAAVAVALLGGCSPSPTTTVTGDDGRPVTVDWADYPGDAGVEAQDAVRAPTQAEAERRGRELLTDVERTLTARYGLRWSTRTEEGWSPPGGNGYGGRSAYVTYNSALRETADLPTEPAQWRALVALVGEVTEEHGLGPVVLEHERLSRGSDERALRAWHEEAGTSDPDRFWVWNGLALDGMQWFAVDLTDAHRHPGPDKTREYRELDIPVRSVRLQYGVTTVADAERPAFAARLAPFDGLRKPAASESD